MDQNAVLGRCPSAIRRALDNDEQAQWCGGLTGVDGSDHQGNGVMGKKRKRPSEQSIFENNPFLDELVEWRDSPEGERSMEVFYTLSDLMEDVRLDAKQRKFVWPDAGRLDLQQSIEHIQKQYPDLSSEEIEEHLLYWIENGYAPDDYSREQLDELDRLALQWVADHTRRTA
jgi:hypothetical protein